jgi:hypothetical protein
MVGIVRLTMTGKFSRVFLEKGFKFRALNFSTLGGSSQFPIIVKSLIDGVINAMVAPTSICDLLHE